MPRGNRPSTAALTRSGARKASEMVMLTWRTLHFCNLASSPVDRRCDPRSSNPRGCQRSAQKRQPDSHTINLTSAFRSIPYVEFSDYRSIHNLRHGRRFSRTDLHWPRRCAQRVRNASKLLVRSRKRVVPPRCRWDRSPAAHSPPSVGIRKSGHSQEQSYSYLGIPFLPVSARAPIRK